jgi:GNAT superfamily N-acetyltransferase
MILIFAPLTETQGTEIFDCGDENLNSYLKNHAFSNQKRRLSTTIVAHSGDSIVGYYTLSPAQIERKIFPTKLAKGLPNYPIPAIRLCRLAVDQRYQGKGFGEELLVHALQKCLLISKEIGGYIVIVDAKNLSIRKFYEKYGFTEFEDHPLFLYLRMKDIEGK